MNRAIARSFLGSGRSWRAGVLARSLMLTYQPDRRQPVNMIGVQIWHFYGHPVKNIARSALLGHVFLLGSRAPLALQTHLSGFLNRTLGQPLLVSASPIWLIYRV